MPVSVGSPFGSFPSEIVQAMTDAGDQPVAYPIVIGDGVSLTAGVRNVYLWINGLVKVIAAGTFDNA